MRKRQPVGVLSRNILVSRKASWGLAIKKEGLSVSDPVAVIHDGLRLLRVI